MNRRGFLLRSAGIAAAAGAGWYGFDRWEQARAESEIVEWVREHGHAFDAEQPDTITADGAIVSALAGAKVIGIGEATHGSHEDVACKAALVRALVRAGAVDTLLLEANGPGARELDAFIASDGGSSMEAAERVRTASIFRILKTQDLADLLTWLRDWNRRAPQPVRIVGVDCQATAADTEFALTWLATVDAGAAADFRTRLADVVSAEAKARRFPDFIAALTTAQLREAMTALEALRDRLSATGPYASVGGRETAERAARTAWQGLHAFELEVSDGKLEGDLSAYYSRRDQAMAENVLAGSTGRGAVYWAHNTHVAGAPFGRSERTFEPTGHFLRQALGAAYKSVLFEFTSVRFLAVPHPLFGKMPPATDPTEIIEWGYTAGRLAGVFRAAGGGDRWIDLTALPKTTGLTDWSARSYPQLAPGYTGVRWVRLSPAIALRPRPTIDVLVHIEAMGPARMLV